MISILVATLVLQNPREFKDLPYVKGGTKSQQLDLFLPAAENKKTPVVIWIHGGGWRSGNKEGGPWRKLVENGFAVASINYRLSSESLFPAQIEDCKAAVRFLRANADIYGLDKLKFGAWGASAGGHLASLLGTSGDVPALEGSSLGNSAQSSRVQAVCDWYGPIDLLNMRVGAAASDLKSPEALLLGGALTLKQDLAKLGSPNQYISKDDPPFFIAHGDRDRTVPISQSETFHHELQSKGVLSEFFVVAGAGHGNLGVEAQNKALSFFRKVLQ